MSIAVCETEFLHFYRHQRGNVFISLVGLFFFLLSSPHMWSRNEINSVLATIYFISAPNLWIHIEESMGVVGVGLGTSNSGLVLGRPTFSFRSRNNIVSSQICNM